MGEFRSRMLASQRAALISRLVSSMYKQCNALVVGGLPSVVVAILGVGSIAGVGYSCSLFESANLTIAGGITYILVGMALSQTSLSNPAGTILLDRVRHIERNWKTHTLRSCMETLAWLYVIHKAHAMGHTLPFAVTMGTMVAVACTLVGELLAETLNEVEIAFMEKGRKATTPLDLS